MDTLWGRPFVSFETSASSGGVIFGDLSDYIVPIKISARMKNLTFSKPAYLSDTEWDEIIDALAKSAGSLE